MDEKYSGGFNTWGIAIFLIILFAAFLGRGNWGGGSPTQVAMPMNSCGVSACQVENRRLSTVPALNF